MRWILPLLCGLALAACGAPGVPDSAAGRGPSYSDYIRDRQAALAPRPPAGAAGGAIAAGPLPPAGTAGGVRVSPALPPGVQTPGARPRGDAPLTIREQRGEVEAFVRPSISDEQDFEAVAARETIESDRERLERLRAQYVVFQPTAVPERAGPSGPNIVAYALSTRNRVGQKLYSRSPFATAAGHARACARFPSADLAQEEFLRRGGPQRDPGNLDPDGDGFACDWDPQPFRLAARGG